MEEMTSLEFKTVLEMVKMIIDSCSSIEEAKEKIDSLSIFKKQD